MASFLTEGTPRWLIGFALVVALHVGVTALVLGSHRHLQDASPGDAMVIDLVPNVSNASETPDEVVGPKVADMQSQTSERTDMADSDPPAPESAPSSVTKPAPENAPDLMAPPSPAERPDVALAPEKPKNEPKTQPNVKPDATKDDAKREDVARQTTPSQASAGSAALLSGGRRPSAAATWGGEIRARLARNRRYPREARSHGWQGRASVRVELDERGHVIGRDLVKSTGREVLDDEALALVQRSDPFPKPPDGMATPITLTVPVDFAIH